MGHLRTRPHSLGSFFAACEARRTVRTSPGRPSFRDLLASHERSNNGHSAPFVIHGLWCTHRECFASVAKKTDDQVLDELMQFYLYAIHPCDRDRPSLGTVSS